MLNYIIFNLILNICYNVYMADYVLARKSRNIASSMIHVFLNILLGIGTVLITVLSGSPLIGILLVLVSKWRTFAVRSRYFSLSLKANLVDIIVGISVVLLAYFGGATFLVSDIILMIFYPIWLLIIKPLSSETATLIQSLIAVFLGMSAAVVMTSGLNSIWLVLVSFLVGYAASRHVLTQSNDRDFTLTTLVCGLIFAEIAWLSSTWSIVYTYENFGLSGVIIPQLSIILTIFAFIYNYARQAMIKYQDDFRFVHIAGPIAFGLILVGIIIVFFSDPRFTILLN